MIEELKKEKKNFYPIGLLQNPLCYDDYVSNFRFFKEKCSSYVDRNKFKKYGEFNYCIVTPMGLKNEFISKTL